MSISALFIKRPVMTTLVMAGILLFGIVSYRNLAVSDLPTVDYPTVSVNASLPGASPETMASSVATPLEKQFSTIAGIDAMTSQSALGNTSITLQFALDRNIDAAAADVQAAISQTLRQLPQNIVPPSYQKVDPSSSPILYFALTSTTMPLSQLDEYAETFLAQRISMVSGVAAVQVYGSQKYAVRIQLDPQAMATRKIGIDEVANAVNTGNVNLPTGVLWGTDKAYTVQANGQLSNAKDFRPLIITYRNGAPVRLQDIGTVVDGVQDSKVASWYNGQRAIVLAIQRQPGTNTVEVAKLVKTAMAQNGEPVSRLGAGPDALRQVGRDSGVRVGREVHAHAHAVPRRARDLHFPSQPLRHHHPEPRPSNVARRNVRGHVPAQLQSRQSLVDGVDAIRGIRRGQCDRHAREHRPSHREGRAGVRVGTRRIARDRLHDSLHDDVARCRVRSDSLPRWTRRPALSRVRGDDRCRDHRLGLRLADAHAHALQPLPQRRTRTKAQPLLCGHRACIQQNAGVLRAHAQTRDGPSPVRARILRAHSPGHARARGRSCRRGFCRARTHRS